MEKKLRSNEIGAQGCYFIRRLANNLGEPQRSYAINAIDRALTFWKAKRVRKPVPLRAPWLLGPNWTRDLRQLLTSHVHRTRCYNTTLQTPSTGIVFTKFPSVMDSLCDHKEAATNGLMAKPHGVPVTPYDPHVLHHPHPDHHLVLDGDNPTFDDGPHTSIATGSLQNKIFPPSKEIQTSLRLALRTWTTRTHSLHYKRPILMNFGTLYSIPLQHPPQSHHTQRYRTLQTSFSRSNLPQRGQASYIPTNLLPRTLFPVPHHHLRRPVGISKIGEQPK